MPHSALEQTAIEQSEFTDAELRAALQRVGVDAQQKAFAIGQPVTILRDGSLVQVHQDGRVVILQAPRDLPNGIRNDG